MKPKNFTAVIHKLGYLFVFFNSLNCTLVHAGSNPAQPELIDSTDYIVVFKPNASSAIIKNQIELMQMYQPKSISANSTLQSYNVTSMSSNKTMVAQLAKLPTNYNSIGKFKWYSGQFHPDAMESLLNNNSSAKSVNQSINHHGAVHYYIRNTAFSLQEFIQVNPPSWGLDRIDQRQGTDNRYSFANSKGKGVTIYLMDSGILEDHEDIAGRVTVGKTVVGDLDDPIDKNGHGTFVAGVCCGTKYGVAKEANIVSVKTLDDKGNGHLSDLLTGLQWIVDKHLSTPNAKSIVNLSLGAFYSQATNDAIEQAMSLGIHFVVAAGNYGEDACKYSPSSTPGAVTVGAIDEDDSVSYYSNFGKCVDIFAPGTNIKSIWPTSKDATRVLTGTSMAAPHVTGIMAIFLSEKDYTPAELSNYLKKYSSLISEDFAINNTGAYYNENKTVVDNAVTTGYKVPGRQDEKTFVNIAFSHPNDSQPFWIYGQALSNAVSDRIC
ncbi:Subtilisin-like protease 8 [Choanephora cucurbitarum]|uniref:Subtilisin-like protease 8 n=1 Tax=Choanephora cucurbitarum TaxID=101091 RepID=A0A1C7NEE9_9FUNG|nr:Subtilisin-like protease 8 [Choanephora cucurbitarum]